MKMIDTAISAYLPFDLCTYAVSSDKYVLTCCCSLCRAMDTLLTKRGPRKESK